MRSATGLPDRSDLDHPTWRHALHSEGRSAQTRDSIRQLVGDTIVEVRVFVSERGQLRNLEIYISQH
jgi:hypothetical protein